MATEEKFDVIVVGAGPAGCAAAYRLAKSGYEVLLLERGKQPGSKNVSGGRLYTYALEELMPDEWRDAPLEREIKREMIMMMTGESAVSINSAMDNASASYSVLRAKFDPWLAQKAEAAGAMLVTGATVDNVLITDGQVSGVSVGDEELYADLVIFADGANSLLADKAGLETKVLSQNVALGVKMVFGLPERVINDRFNVLDGQGAACLMVGECTKGIAGGGFLYTNKESVSLGLVLDSQALMKARLPVAGLAEDLTAHPAIAPLVRAGELLEYSAHLIPEGGLAMLPSLYGNGAMIVGDAAGFVVNSALTVRGMDYAILSGIAAAETACEALACQDFSNRILQGYEQRLRQTVLKDMGTFKKVHGFMQSTPGLYTTYPKLAETIFQNIFSIDGKPAKRLATVVKESVLSQASLWQLCKDGLKGAFSL